MFKKNGCFCHRMRYPLLVSVTLAGLFLSGVLALVLTTPHIPFLTEVVSTLGNTPGIAPYFIAGGVAFTLGAALFLWKAFAIIGQDTLWARRLILSLAVVGVVLVAMPYNKEQVWFRWGHTALGFIAAGLIVLLGVEFDKAEKPAQKGLAWLRAHTPKALGFGTAGLVAATGVSMVMEAYAMVLSLLWLVLVGLNASKAKDNA